ncbi:MAG: hypothetical protein WC162_10045 [Sphaerochaetaceae bacterium]
MAFLISTDNEEYAISVAILSLSRKLKQANDERNYSMSRLKIIKRLNKQKYKHSEIEALCEPQEEKEKIWKERNVWNG